MDLENLISKKICDFLLKDNTEQNEEIVSYGVQLMVETVFKYCLLLLVAIIFNQGLACVIYIILLSGLRANAGGAHAKTNAGCTLTLFLSFGGGALLNQLEIPVWVSLAVGILALVVFIKYAPAATENNPITDKAVRRKKKIWSVVWICVSQLISMSTDFAGYVISIEISITIAIIILIYNSYGNRKEKGRLC